MLPGMHSSEDPPSSSPAPSLLVEVGERREAVVVTVAGELDYPAAPGLRDTLAAARAQLDGRLLVLDLTAVRFFGSAGVATVLEGAAATEPNTDHVRPFRVVVHDNRPVTRALAVSGLDRILHLYRDLDAALTDPG